MLFTIEPYRPARQMLRNMVNAMQKTPDYRPPFDHVIFVNDILRIGGGCQHQYCKSNVD